jgi:hypothetical protein
LARLALSEALSSGRRRLLVYEQEGVHSTLVVGDTGRGREVTCACGFTTRADRFEQAYEIAEQHLGPS